MSFEASIFIFSSLLIVNASVYILLPLQKAFHGADCAMDRCIVLKLPSRVRSLICLLLSITTQTLTVHCPFPLLSHFFGFIGIFCVNKSYAKCFLLQNFLYCPFASMKKTKEQKWIFISFRTLNGLGILVCSMDGSVAFLDFSQDELGDPLSEEEKVQ